MERPIFERLIHVPGPNPILKPGKGGDWDDGPVMECGGVLKDGHRYYMYYHGQPTDHQRWGRGLWRLGVATATHPLGPWTKCSDRPMLDVGPEGSWDSENVACPVVLKEGEKRYHLWYCGMSPGEPYRIGLATAESPLGPWTRHGKNPVIEDLPVPAQFSAKQAHDVFDVHWGGRPPWVYVGGVVRVGGKYHMYLEYPVGANSPDQGPFCLSTAESPEGPWELSPASPILEPGDWGSWDDGGYSEAGMLYHEGVFHTFYGGTKWQKFESIGYAYSLDGETFHRHPQNPVVMRERCPGISALAEVHALFEPPLFYLYATQRYIKSLDERGSNCEREHIGANVLATSVPFRFDMPLLTMDSLAGGTVTELEACPPIGLENINTLGLTAECTYDTAARGGLRVEMFPSYDGLHYDTEPMASFDNILHAGQRCQKTVAVDPIVKFAKVALLNLDREKAISDVKLIAMLGCV